ncbi:MAG TPA: DUF1697 domain-containing protein [Caldithrix sp.]|nr:DUF1697 domain-containing protein [Caldithrix sp.]
MIYISLLRGINVSGQKKIQMAELKSLYESLGFENVTTYIQSGNVVFSSKEIDELKLAKLISDKIREVLGYNVSIIIRSKIEWEKLIADNPFSKRENFDVKKMHVTLITEQPTMIGGDIFDRVKYDSEEYVIGERHIYLYFPEGYGQTKLSNNYIENKLKVSATTRNWNTVMKLSELAGR